MARILVISSQVVRGHIGLCAILPALQALGHEVWPLPTILLSNHPGHSHSAGVRMPVDRLDAMLDALEANGWLAEVDAVLTGYLPSLEHAAFAARAIGRVLQKRPDSLVLVDPVLGDEPKGLYVDSAVAAAIRDTLVPLAHVTTPNLFELSWLTGRSIEGLEVAQAAASRLGCPSVVVTSAARAPVAAFPLRSGDGSFAGTTSPTHVSVVHSPFQGAGDAGREKIITLLVSSDITTTFQTVYRAQVPHGTGDLFSALLIGHLLEMRRMPDAVARAVAGVACAIEASVGRDELALAGGLAAIAAAQASSVMGGPPSDWIAGVDGCPGGWLVVLRRLDDPASAKALIVSRFSDVLALPEAPRLIAVDMPIGLAERSSLGGRHCDVEARANLGQRQSSVFAVPSRAAVMETDYRRACDAAFATSVPPRMVAKQTFNLFSKIREIDALMTPALQERIVEVHPELAFWALNGEQPLAVAKKVKSRSHPPGLALRRDLLERTGYDRAFLEAHPFRRADAGRDDLLDATVCSWTAARIVGGTARRLPADPPRDARGLRMEIWG